MKWGDLRPGDVVVNHSFPEVCLLLEREGRVFTWFILEGESHLAWGSNPYTVDDVDVGDTIQGWDVLRAAER